MDGTTNEASWGWGVGESLDKKTVFRKISSGLQGILNP